MCSHYLHPVKVKRLRPVFSSSYAKKSKNFFCVYYFFPFIRISLWLLLLCVKIDAVELCEDVE